MPVGHSFKWRLSQPLSRIRILGLDHWCKLLRVAGKQHMLPKSGEREGMNHGHLAGLIEDDEIVFR